MPSIEPTPVSQTLSGTLELHGRSAAAIGDQCYGTGGYDDVVEGAQVTVTDQDGTLIATGALEKGEMNDARTICTFSFVVDGIPEAKFYSIEVSHRGDLTYSAAQLAAKSWVVAFTLGT